MKKIVTIILLFTAFSLSAQDYLVEESYEPKNYSRNPFSGYSSNPNHRGIYGWGIYDNTASNDGGEDFWGSNFFYLKYQYNQPLFLGTFAVFGTGYNWSSFKYNPPNNKLYGDSISYDKSKFRFQNISSHIGLRFQTKKDPDESYFLQINAYWDILTHSAYVGWLKNDEDVKIRNKKFNLNDAKIHSFGVEIRTGYAPLVLIGRYRLTNHITNNNVELTPLSIGLDIEIPWGD